jgi:hypothetical protein
VLKSPLYVGKMMYGPELYDGEHPRLIDDDAYQQAQSLLAGPARLLRHTGTSPEYLLRGLLRCGGCGAAMTPASTTKASNGKRYRFYRCSTREKYGRAHCQTGNSLPARALEEFVVERIAEATADGQLAQRVYNKLTARLDAERKTIESLRGVLATQVAEAANITKKLTEDLTTFDGRARQLVEEKLRAEANKLGEAEGRQRALARTNEELADAERHRDWFVSALRSFAKVWGDMTPENQGRFLRALVAKVSVDERDESCTVELVDFDAAAGTATKEAT